MTFDFTLPAVGFALLIFGLRIINNGIGTLRLVLINRGHKFWSSVFSFFEALTFAVVVASVVRDLSNFLNLMAYCGGYAAGNWLAMLIEERFITSFMTVNVFTRSETLADALRARGYGVTEAAGEGRDGAVLVLRSIVTHRDVPRLLAAVQEHAPESFVAVYEAKAVHHGWLPAAPRRSTINSSGD